MHGHMFKVFRRVLPFQDVDQLLHILRAGFWTDESGVRRIDHHHVGEPDRRHETAIPVDDRPAAIEVDHTTDHHIPGLILRRHFIQAPPTPDVRPLKGHRHDRGFLRSLHNTRIDRDRLECPVGIVDGQSGRPCLHQLADPFDPTKEGGLMASNLIKNRRGAPNKHAAVPVVVPSLEILRSLGGIGFFNESADRMALERTLFFQRHFPVGPDVTVACLRTDRLDTKRHQIVPLRQRRRQRHRCIERSLAFDDMIGRNYQHNRVRIPTDQF